MRRYSALPNEIKSLKKDISEFQESYSRRLADVPCSSDCYCRKQGKHKVTNSLYHKECITMKKATNATVLKTDIIPPRRKCHERVDVFNMNKARVEVAIKKPINDKKKIDFKAKSDAHNMKHTVKLIDKGTDPITIVEPKVASKQSWSDILTHTHSKSNAQRSGEPNFKSTSRSTDQDRPKYQYSESSSPVTSYKNQPKVVVRDRGTQSLDEITKGDLIPICLPRLPTDSISNPLISLQSLVKELKDFRRRVPNQKDYNTICCIISEMEIALNVLSQHDKTSPRYESTKNLGCNYTESKENYIKSSASSDRLYKNLEETCTQLRIACQHLEETCEKLRQEKDHVTEKFFEKSREVEGCLKRELEYQAKLSHASSQASSMSLKLDQYSRSVEELSGHVRKLKEEKRMLEKAEEDKVRLHTELMEASRQNDKLNAEVQLLTLEREKNKVLLDIKEKELDKLRKQLVTISGMISEKMKDKGMGGDNLQYSRLGSTASHLDLDLSETRTQEIASSSPDGSVTSPSKSWKAMSSITGYNRQHQVISAYPFSAHKSDEQKRTSKGDTPPLESIKHLKNELRELFAQMKKQTEVSEALLLPDVKAPSDSTIWSSVTDSSDGYISITEADCSDQDT